LKKLAATLLLVGTAVLFGVARHYEPTHWAWGYVASFAAAATVGGLADWYAVVALFRRPLGLPIPHTAIIPRNHQRIAENLGAFIETNFLASEAVEKKLGEVDFATQVAEWLSDPEVPVTVSAKFVGTRKEDRMTLRTEEAEFPPEGVTGLGDKETRTPAGCKTHFNAATREWSCRK